MTPHPLVFSFILAFALISVVPVAYCQPQDSVRMFLAGGIGVPSGPQTFYDFWKPGVSVGGGIRWAWKPEYYYGLQGEISRFSLDDGRYVKTLRLPSGAASVGGGTSTIVSVGGIVGSTTTDPNEYVQVSGDLGVGLLFSFVSATTGAFSGYTREAPGVAYGAVFLTGAGRAELATYGSWNIAIEGKVRLGITGNKLANTDFSTLRFYLSRSLKAR